jgi:hypothetical protein
MLTNEHLLRAVRPGITVKFDDLDARGKRDCLAAEPEKARMTAVDLGSNPTIRARRFPGVLPFNVTSPEIATMVFDR